MARRTKYEFEVRNYSANDHFKKDGLATLDEAHKLLRYTNQCTWEDTQTAQGYSHILEYRDDEHVYDMYFI